VVVPLVLSDEREVVLRGGVVGSGLHQRLERGEGVVVALLEDRDLGRLDRRIASSACGDRGVGLGPRAREIALLLELDRSLEVLRGSAVVDGGGRRGGRRGRGVVDGGGGGRGRGGFGAARTAEQHGEEQAARSRDRGGHGEERGHPRQTWCRAIMPRPDGSQNGLAWTRRHG